MASEASGPFPRGPQSCPFLWSLLVCYLCHMQGKYFSTLSGHRYFLDSSSRPCCLQLVLCWRVYAPCTGPFVLFREQHLVRDPARHLLKEGTSMFLQSQICLSF